MSCLKCICSLYCSSITIDFFYLLNDLYSSLKITLISVLLIFVYQNTYFFCYFSVIILNHKTCHEFAYQHAYSAATCLLFFCRFAQQHSYSANTFIWQSKVYTFLRNFLSSKNEVITNILFNGNFKALTPLKYIYMDKSYIKLIVLI